MTAVVLVEIVLLIRILIGFWAIITISVSCCWIVLLMLLVTMIAIFYMREGMLLVWTTTMLLKVVFLLMMRRIMTLVILLGVLSLMAVHIVRIVTIWLMHLSVWI